MEELKTCPFCGGEVSVVVLDEEGNIRDEEYERDPYSGLRYAVAHDDPNGECPIATCDEPLPWLYDSRDGMAHVWNRRAERTCRDEAGSQQSFLCSECGWFWNDQEDELGFSYCPNCGAKVLGE